MLIQLSEVTNIDEKLLGDAKNDKCEGCGRITKQNYIMSVVDGNIKLYDLYRCDCGYQNDKNTTDYCIALDFGNFG